MMYSPLAGGLLTGKYRNGATGRLVRNSGSPNEEDFRTKNIIDYLSAISDELNASPGQIALAWVLSKGCFPMVGALHWLVLKTV